MRVLVLLLLGVLPLTSALAATAPLTQPNAYAVVIGISQYREEVIPKVAYAVKDAEAMAQMLEKQAGIPKAHIRLLTDSKATSADLRSVGSWLKMRVTSASVVYVYYAGHGTPNTKTAESYLVPWDGHPDYPDGLYPLNDLYTTLSQLPVKEVLVVLDSCFSGAAGRSVLAKGARPMVLSMESQTLASHNMIVLAAATGNQISSDYDKAGHGLFTHALLTGLQGAADTNNDGLVTVKELYPYVRERVATLAVDELNREQTPVLFPSEQALGARSALPIAMAIQRAPEVLKKPMASLSQAEQELKALEAQEQAVDTQAKQAEVQRKIEAKKQQIADKQKKLEVASLPSYSAPKELGRQITGQDGAPMLLVPEGEFLYGDDKQRLSLSAFYMDKFEVSTALYAKHLGATGAQAPSEWPTSVLVSQGQKPVVGVSWHEAEAYCRAYEKRLPTEQEWEKAARGTDGRLYPWGNEEPTSRHANFGKFNKNSKDSGFNNYGVLITVGSLEAGKSPYGIYDLAGNVWEWTSSDYDDTHKVFRGGSWFINAVNLRAARRLSLTPLLRTDDLGFRCAQDRPN